MEFVAVGVLALVAVFAVVGWVAASKRRKALEALAASWGFTWDGGDPCEIGSRYDRFSAIGRGSGRRASNVFHGERNGRGVICFDYQYTTGTGKNRQMHRLSAALIDLGVRTPRLYVRAENFLDKIAEFVGVDDIDFESAEFSRKFLVKSDNRKFAFDVFHARAMEYMMSLPRTYGMEFLDGQVMVYNDRVWGAAEFDASIRQVEGLVEKFPDYLQRALREGTL